jgi:anion-transporting  ArsA/GET3 family ATPase
MTLSQQEMTKARKAAEESVTLTNEMKQSVIDEKIRILNASIKKLLPKKCDCWNFCAERQNILNIRERIQAHLDELSSLLEAQSHIHAPVLVTEKIESVTKFWSVLKEEEREYAASVRTALNEILERQVSNQAC